MYPSVEPVVSLLASLLNQVEQIRGRGPTVQFGVALDPSQATLDEEVMFAGLFQW
jgi:hypothetical protein